MSVKMGKSVIACKNVLQFVGVSREETYHLDQSA